MLEFPQELYLKIANFIQWVIYHPLLWQDLSDSTKIPDELMIDEITIEMGKFFLMGQQNYLNDIIPVRMYGQQRVEIFKEDIVKLGTIHWNNLQKISDEKQIIIYGQYRGIDIVLANFVKHWDKIIYFEPNEYLLSRTKEYFTDDNIVFTSSKEIFNAYSLRGFILNDK